MKLSFSFCFLLATLFSYVYSDYLQERARLLYTNPKYIKDCTIFTGRNSRNNPYYTNLTLTTLVPCGNDVSVALTLQLMSGGDFRLSQKLCDIMKEVWIVNFLKAHTNLDTACPISPGTYSMYNMELPPKNMPIPMIASDYNIILEIYQSATKEQMLKATTTLRYKDSKWKRQ